MLFKKFIPHQKYKKMAVLEVAKIGLNVLYVPVVDIFAQPQDPMGPDPVAAIITKVIPPPPIEGDTTPELVNLVIFPDLSAPQWRENIRHRDSALTDQPFFKFMSDTDDPGL